LYLPGWIFLSDLAHNFLKLGVPETLAQTIKCSVKNKILDERVLPFSGLIHCDDGSVA